MQTRKQLLRSSLTVAALLVALSGTAQASLTTIGTATYGGQNYNLIWDNDNNGKSIVWLDYTKGGAAWYDQVAWAAGLGNSISSINLKTGYSLNWSDTAWRLPSTVDGPYVNGTNGTTTAGYNITNSELGHLYYTELGNKGYLSTTGAYQPDNGLKNKGDFAHLQSDWYYSGTDYAATSGGAWSFLTFYGYQYPSSKYDSYYLGIAVRSGQVLYQEETLTPLPAALPLFGSGLAALAGLRFRRRVR